MDEETLNSVDTGGAAEAAAPYRAEVGTQARRALLEAELERFVRYVIGHLNPWRVIVFGSMASGQIAAWSDLDVAVMVETDRPFLERIEGLLKSFRPRVGMDLLVYTPAECERLRENQFVHEEIMKKGTVVYER